MQSWRINTVLILIFLFGALVVSKLFLIQVMNGDFYSAMAKGQALYRLDEKVEDSRGDIL
jgi:cell division protein FtsI/penicillin-binding protein 2